MHWLRTTFYLFRNLGFYVSEQKKQPPNERSRSAVTYMAKLYLGVHVRCAFCIIIGRSLTLIVFSSVFKIFGICLLHYDLFTWQHSIRSIYPYEFMLSIYVRFSMGLLTGLLKFYCTFTRCLHGYMVKITNHFSYFSLFGSKSSFHCSYEWLWVSSPSLTHQSPYVCHHGAHDNQTNHLSKRLKSTIEFQNVLHFRKPISDLRRSNQITLL